METNLSYNIYLTRDETHAFHQTLGLSQHSPLSHTANYYTCLPPPASSKGTLQKLRPTHQGLGRAGKCFLCMAYLSESLLTCVVGTNMMPISQTGSLGSERPSDLSLSHSFERANPDSNMVSKPIYVLLLLKTTLSRALIYVFTCTHKA